MWGQALKECLSCLSAGKGSYQQVSNMEMVGKGSVRCMCSAV